MRVLCPAKINLHLRVGRRRNDGFHPLLTWMTTVGLFDRLTLEALPPTGTAAAPSGRHPGRATQSDKADVTAARGHDQPPPGRARPGTAAGIVRLSGDLPGLLTGPTNLVVRAAEVFAAAIAATGSAGDGESAAIDRRGVMQPGVASGGEPLQGAAAGASRADAGVWEGAEGVDAPGRAGSAHPAGPDPEAIRVEMIEAVLEKRIPLGAGLGGGSSDAARTLIGLNRLWRVGWPEERVSALAAGLGSDVPFFLHGPSSVCMGRGEIVCPVPPPVRAKWAVLVLPDVHMPTPDVYRRFDAMGLGFDDAMGRPPDWRRWASLPAEKFLPRLVNDLEQPAFDIQPELGTLRRAVEVALSRPVRMSGSGSSLFTLFDARGAAESAAAGVAARFGVTALAVEVAPALDDDLATYSPRRNTDHG